MKDIEQSEDIDRWLNSVQTEGLTSARINRSLCLAQMAVIKEESSGGGVGYRGYVCLFELYMQLGG